MNLNTHIKAETINGKEGHIGLLTLNRPEALNALSLSMIQVIDNYIHAWELDDRIKAIVIRGAGEKAFCAGGDIKQVYIENQANNPHINRFFWHEYRLNHHIHNCSKPYIALMDGITMGGGVGISAHGAHRIGTERLVFAMPETKIGFFPDVGSSYFLPRCPNSIGYYLGLTGARLKAHDAHYLHLVDHIVPSDRLDDIVQALADTSLDRHNGHAMIAQCITSFSTIPEASSLDDLKTEINHCFSASTITSVIDRLQQMDNEWSNTTLQELESRSPTSLVVTLKQLQEGKRLDFDHCMKMEYRLANRFLKGHDFFEGVRAVIIDKDNQPHWKPQHINEVSNTMVDRYFEPLEEDLRFN